LEERGLIDVRSERAGPEREIKIYRLTEKGLKLGEKLWRISPEHVRNEITKTKKRLNNLTAKEVVDLVHKEHPGMWDKTRTETWETE